MSFGAAAALGTEAFEDRPGTWSVADPFEVGGVATFGALMRPPTNLFELLHVPSGPRVYSLFKQRTIPFRHLRVPFQSQDGRRTPRAATLCYNNGSRQLP